MNKLEEIENIVYIFINYDNIQLGCENQFDMLEVDHGHQFYAYNFGSLMHYVSYSFSKNGQPTIISKNGERIGFRNFLSALDVASINKLYPVVIPGKLPRWLMIPDIYSSPNPKITASCNLGTQLNEQQILWFRVKDIYDLNRSRIDENLRGGIKSFKIAHGPSEPRVTLDLFMYDSIKINGIEHSLYGCYSRPMQIEKSTGFKERHWTFSPIDNRQIANFQKSTDISGLFTSHIDAAQTLGYIRGARLDTNVEFAKARIPVVVKLLTLELGAYVFRYKLLGLGEFSPTNLSYIQLLDGGELRVAPKNAFIVPATPAVKVYPNPTDGELTLHLEEKAESDATIRVLDFSGKHVYTQPNFLEQRRAGNLPG